MLTEEQVEVLKKVTRETVLKLGDVLFNEIKQLRSIRGIYKDQLVSFFMTCGVSLAATCITAISENRNIPKLNVLATFFSHLEKAIDKPPIKQDKIYMKLEKTINDN